MAIDDGVVNEGGNGEKRAATVRTAPLLHASLQIVCISTAAAAVIALATILKKKTLSGRRCVVQPKLRTLAIVRPKSGMNCTPWEQLVSCGTTADFLVLLNVIRSGFFDKLLPFFVEERAKLNSGCPYRHGPRSRGRKSFLRSVDLLGLVLWKLNCKDCLYRICFDFGIVPSSASRWFDFAAEVLLKVV